MKKFSSFLSEAKLSQASMQAKKMGLRPDGHGGWYNAQGEFVAKTVGGELKFYNQGQKPGEKDTPAQGRQAQSQQQPVPVRRAEQEPQQQTGPEDGESGALTLVFGKFNPPSKAHQKFLNFAKTVSSNTDLKIYPSRSQDPKMNPLDPDTKIKYMKKMFPDYADNIINDENAVSIFDVLTGAEKDGYTEIQIVVSPDRVSEFRSLSTKYNGDLYNFNDITVIPAGDKEMDTDSDTETAKLRKAAMDDNFDSFKTKIPSTLGLKDTQRLFNLVKKNISEESKLWEIAPKLDYKNLRENYIDGNIFNKDIIVENLNTGLRGKVIRRGTNYLICTTESDIMFKSWITDVVEKKAYTDISGVVASKREVGTPSYTAYTMDMSDVKKIRNFINKYKAKK
jgi:hypothetical protein